MDLKTFFKRHPDWTKNSFAIACGTQCPTVYQWIQGKQPRLDFALKIQEVTGGLVTLDELIAKKGKK